MRSSRWLALPVAMALCVVGSARAAEGPPSGDENREVIVKFTHDAVRLPQGAAVADLATMASMPSGLRDLLGSAGVDRVRVAFPKTLSFLADHSITGDRAAEKLATLRLNRVLVLRTQSAQSRDGLITALKRRGDVLYAEPNGRLVALGNPNDVSFVKQWNLQNIGQSGGVVGSDIHAWWAWQFSTGGDEPIGILEVLGNVAPHDEFGARLYGNLGTEGHPTEVAGVAAASGGNAVGIAGVNWMCGIRSDGDGHDVGLMADNIYHAMGAGIRVLNNSYQQSTGVDWSVTYADALVYAYNNDAVCVFGMPTSDKPNQYPSNYFGGAHSINVGACDDRKQYAPYQLPNPWVHVAAPGGTDDLAVRKLYTTEPGNGYGYVSGGSYAVPHVSGAASLLRTYSRQLLGVTLTLEDVRELLERSAVDIYPAYFDDYTGFGEINLGRAVEYLRPPNGWVHGSAVGGTVTSSWADYRQMTFQGVPVLEDYAIVQAKQYQVDRTVNLSFAGSGSQTLWSDGSTSLGYNGANPTNYGDHYCRLVSGTEETATFRTFVYYVVDLQGRPIGNGWYPTSPDNVVYAWTTLSWAPIPYAFQAVSSTNSFYVPQTGSVSSPTEGQSAISLFRACPNNDGGASLPNNTRVEVVARDTNNQPMAGVSPADIYILFNGGTAAQGYVGAGADSVIANSQWNQNPLCPDVRVLTADTPTDASGVTYITFTGSTPGSPGVGTRDPNRKWGHYDSELPVYVLGTKLQGRLTSGSANGTYVLQIKNFDFEGGLGVVMNVGEAVNFNDYSSVAAHLDEADSVTPKNWWRDFNSDGVVNFNDLSMFVAHLDHNCAYPNNP